VITLHRLGGTGDAFVLNPDLIATVEAHPDTVVHLTTERMHVVRESVDEVVEAVREWRVSVLTGALKRKH
jgi:flagellar protein FlbD